MLPWVRLNHPFCCQASSLMLCFFQANPAFPFRNIPVPPPNSTYSQNGPSSAQQVMASMLLHRYLIIYTRARFPALSSQRDYSPYLRRTSIWIGIPIIYSFPRYTLFTGVSKVKSLIKAMMKRMAASIPAFAYHDIPIAIERTIKRKFYMYASSLHIHEMQQVLIS